ncbi:uncharacterized protein BP5553_09245 [Venustampulla echinocandica]|uniref:Uncharacterized protein n=1 Tax=Venustampulla echinocandica TaxID=2656787 RepID=A0A370TC60_9HELO|nr:uncharacterized protein BP5553_09245 [Venustampulla echinocandica]RDL31843.1 hypothetical protein BP5553_09245 [Venustampulla echinocandica]
MNDDTSAGVPGWEQKQSKRKRLRSFFRPPKDSDKGIPPASQPAPSTEVNRGLNPASPSRSEFPIAPAARVPFNLVPSSSISTKPIGVIEWINQLPDDPPELLPETDPRATNHLWNEVVKSKTSAPSNAPMAPPTPQSNSASQVFTGRECFAMLQQCYGIREVDRSDDRGAALYSILIDFKSLSKKGVSAEAFAKAFGAMSPELVISKLFTKLELVISPPGKDGKPLVRPILRTNDLTLYNSAKPNNPSHKKWLEPTIVGEYKSEALGVRDGSMVRGNLRLTSNMPIPAWQAANLPLQRDINLSLDGKHDMAFWLKASWFPHDMALVKEHMFVNKYGETCPYLHVIIDDLDSAVFGAVRERYVKSKVAMKSAMHLYNRWLLRKKVLSVKKLTFGAKGDEGSVDNIRQYAISVVHDAYIIYSFNPRVRDNRWRGCEMVLIYQGRLSVEEELKGFVTEFDRIQQWGESIFLDGIAKDLDECIEPAGSN